MPFGAGLLLCTQRDIFICAGRGVFCALSLLSMQRNRSKHLATFIYCQFWAVIIFIRKTVMVVGTAWYVVAGRLCIFNYYLCRDVEVSRFSWEADFRITSTSYALGNC